MSRRKNEERTTMSGKACLYRGKVRSPIAFTADRGTRVLLDRNLERTGMSRNDFLTSLIRMSAHKVTGQFVPLPADLQVYETEGVPATPSATRPSQTKARARSFSRNAVES